MDAKEPIAAYWAACNARDWGALGALVADDVVYDLPQSRERIEGRERLVQFDAEYPGEWEFVVERLVADGRHAATWTRAVMDGIEQVGLSFFDLDDNGLIARITEFWPEPYDPPEGREHLTERY